MHVFHILDIYKRNPFLYTNSSTSLNAVLTGILQQAAIPRPVLQHIMR